MVDLTFLPGLIPVVLFEFFFILAMYKYQCCCCKCKCCKIDCKSDEYNEEESESKGKIDTFVFQDTYDSFLPGLKYLLFVTRFLSFAYIAGVGVIANYASRGDTHIWFYFTVWNTKLISIYFLFAMTTSIIGFVYESRENNDNDDNSDTVFADINGRGAINSKTYGIVWPARIITFGRIVHVLFQVCGGTACMVTVINFTALNPAFSFWNVSQHFITLMVMILELFLNNMYVRADHYPFNLFWAFLYIIFIWPLVAQERISFWPYFFLDTSTPYCFAFYTGLIIADIIFYYVFYALSWPKYYFRQCIESGKMKESRGKTHSITDFNGYRGDVEFARVT
mmetsp:Transcript_17614/g.16957  ORF Transcript_17614/g.16957 Transcript_17614/m.16957 type:complete len:338 (-) Transcript_17614:124-1137(-)